MIMLSVVQQLSYHEVYPDKHAAYPRLKFRSDLQNNFTHIPQD